MINRRKVILNGSSAEF